MGLYTADLEIENAALSRVKGRPITSLTDGSNEASLVKLNWKVALAQVMRDHRWADQIVLKEGSGMTPKAFSGARTEKYIELAAGTETIGTADLKLFGATKPLAHLTDFQVVGVSGDLRWRLEGTRLISGMFPAGALTFSLAYVQIPIGAVAMDFAGVYDPLLIEAYILKLAQKINFGASGAIAIEQKLMAEYADIIAQARRRDGFDDKGMAAGEIGSAFNAEQNPSIPVKAGQSQ